MSAPLAPALAATFAPPVMEARRWLQGVDFPADRPLINISQAAPMVPPPLELRQAMAEAILTEASTHLYGPDLGNTDLREALAERTSEIYGATITGDQVAITSGCNMAFTGIMATLCSPGDGIILPKPWYFNHAMWAMMNGVELQGLDTGPTLIPDPEAARALITPRTRAIVLVTPNNPGGVEYPPATIAAFRDLARAHGLALVIDETYRDFHSSPHAPHDLFQDPDWHEDVIHLYSFSKAYRLTGHRTGAVIASAKRLAEYEKYMDTVQICAAQPGQFGALWGIRHLNAWLAEERREILSRRDAIAQGIASLPGWTLRGAGAYFAYVEHPFDMPGEALCKALVREAGLLMLPGSFFRPEGDPKAPAELRIAFANIDVDQIAEVTRRLADLPFPLAPRAQAG